jgi:hypothetical protein
VNLPAVLRQAMYIPAAIVAAALIVGASIALTSHWSIAPTGNLIGAFRLNRWTGEVVWCATPLGQTKNRLDCEAR